jgi:arylsulfatase A-like enzyme
LLAWGVSGCGEPPRPDVATSIVVFVSLDTARADHFGFLGNGRIRTPRLDALARESIVFDDYMTVAPTTLASHTSLFTGMYPHHHSEREQ